MSVAYVVLNEAVVVSSLTRGMGGGRERRTGAKAEKGGTSDSASLSEEEEDGESGSESGLGARLARRASWAVRTTVAPEPRLPYRTGEQPGLEPGLWLNVGSEMMTGMESDCDDDGECVGEV